MLYAAEEDFGITKKGKFQLLRHPESFRACLIQVSRPRYSDTQSPPGRVSFGR